MRYTGFCLMALAILVITVLAACGGGSDDSGGSGSTSTSTPFQATPASPAEVSSTQASPSRAASTSATASSSVPAPTSEPTVVAPKPTSPPEPTEAPAKVSLPAPVTMFNCEDQFRQMLVDYDGVEEFGAEVVTRLSVEFTEVRPDCLGSGLESRVSGGASALQVNGRICRVRLSTRSPRQVATITSVRPCGHEIEDFALYA